MAQAAIGALENKVHHEDLCLLDVGGGAGNLISHMLDALAVRRGHLEGVTYILTDGAQTMAALTKRRFDELREAYPGVQFRAIHVDTLSDDFVERVGSGVADVVVSSWNIDYYPFERRAEIVSRLARLGREQNVVAFSSLVRLPDGLTIRDVLMPLGGAQVVYAFLTGGPRKMRKVITGLKQIAQFGTAVTDNQFPEKPTLSELKELAEHAGLGSIHSTYHLYGASGMVVARKKPGIFSGLKEFPISHALAGKEGYDNHSETVTFWGYLLRLLRSR